MSHRTLSSLATRRRAERAAAPRGFTIVELLVALLIMTAGLLGIIGSSTFVSRTITEGTQQALVARVAQSRFDVLRTSNWSCANYQTDSATTRGVKQVWTVTQANSRSVDVSLALTYTTRRYDKVANTYQRTVRYRSVILCN